jgi:hypothetical protein
VLFYLLQQTIIIANPDGTIGVPTFPSYEPKPYREIAPFLWCEVGGRHEVALVQQDGNKTVHR